MGKIEEYQARLKVLDEWDAYLLKEARLPGPRANLELAFAVAAEGDEERFLGYSAISDEAAPVNTPAEFLAFCGVLGLGYLAARGEVAHFSLLRTMASDPRWRIREAVALGLPEYGRTSPASLLELMGDWSQGSLLERRAVVATLCEPGLLQEPGRASKIVDIIHNITASILDEPDRRTEPFRVLRKALAYGWSVLVAAQPEIGKPRMESWMTSPDADIRWIMKQNLKKKRLLRMDEVWVDTQLDVIESRRPSRLG